MFLKKINSELQHALIESGFEQANTLQQDTFSLFKSGADIVLAAPPYSGKTTTLALNIIQRLDKPFEQSPRALVIVSDKEKVLELVSLFKQLNQYNKLRVYHSYEQTNIDNDKNLISVGIDILIGTPKKLAELFSGAGFDINQLKIFAIDDLDIILKNRQEVYITRLLNAIERTQKVFTCQVLSDKIEILSENLMQNPNFIEFYDSDEEESE